MNLDKYKGLFFDFDYTLANSEKAILQCFSLTFKHCNIPEPDAAATKATIGIPLDDAFKLLTGIKDENIVADFITVYKKYADQYMTQMTTLYPGVKDMLIELHRQGKIIGIISNKMARRIRQTLTAEKLTPYVDIVLGCDILAHPKPNPEGLLLAMKEMHLQPAETIYLGDHTVDAEFARNAGTNFIAVLTGNTSAETFAQYPRLTILQQVTDLLPADKQK